MVLHVRFLQLLGTREACQVALIVLVVALHNANKTRLGEGSEYLNRRRVIRSDRIIKDVDVDVGVGNLVGMLLFSRCQLLIHDMPT